MFGLSRKGFTLVEIMIVVAIIALLAAIAIPNLLQAKIHANETAAQSTLKSFATACEAYATAYDGRYPETADALVNADPPFFSYNLNGTTKGGYTFAADDRYLKRNGYTATATAISEQTGNWDYQITTCFFLGRKAQGTTGDYEPW